MVKVVLFLGGKSGESNDWNLYKEVGPVTRDHLIQSGNSFHATKEKVSLKIQRCRLLHVP